MAEVSLSSSYRIFLTGATGQVGGCVLEGLVRAGHHVVCLARSGRGQSAEDRIRHTLSWLGFDAGLPFDVLEGDLNQPQFGLGADDYRRLTRSVDLVIHSAARIVFKADSDGEPFRTNLHGTEQVVQLARDAGRVPLCYVSTAYVCGNAEGLVREVFHEQAPHFKNAYEESKWKAEQVVWTARQDGLPVCILRPSIVVGDSVKGRALHFQGFYLVSRAITRLCRAMGHDRAATTIRDLELFLPGNAESPVNLVPADYVSDAICYLATRPQLYGHVYHLTHPKPVTMQGIHDALSSYFRLDIDGFRGQQKAPVKPDHERAAMARLFWKVSSPVHDYFHSTPTFDCSRAQSVLSPAGINPVDVDQRLMVKLLSFADLVEYGRKTLADVLALQSPSPA